jgi:hypothetical protein
VALGLCLGLLAAFIGFRDLPMVDLPQHAAQIVTWQRLDAGVADVARRFELNFRTPYLLAYPVARVLAPLFGAVVALKLVVWLAVVLNLVVTELLARRLGHEPWLGLLGLVTAMGLCFYFGFVSFMLAMPLAVGALILALEHASRPRPVSGALLGAGLCLLLTAHGVAFVMGFGVVGLLLLRGQGTLAGRLLPLAAPVALAASFFAPGPVSVRVGGDAWDLSPLRLLELPALLVGMTAADHVALLLGLALLVAAVAVLGGRTSKEPLRWAPLALLFAAYCFFPGMFRGIVLLHTRLPCFLLPLACLALEPRTAVSERQQRGGRLAILGVTLVWLAIFCVRLAAFNREAAPFHALAAAMRPGQSLRPLVFERETNSFPGVPAFLHYPAYYYVEKGGSQGYSFAMYPLSVVRYRPDVPLSMQGGAEWRPDWFRKSEVAQYDYFVVKSSRDLGDELFLGTSVALEAHAGSWWIYARRSDQALHAHSTTERATLPSGT